MADVKILAPFILKWEGAISNDPDDAGGLTNKGITYETYKYYCNIKRIQHPTVEKFLDMTYLEWMNILKTLYWDRWKADYIDNQSIANILVDWVWASGKYGIIRPQRILGVEDDGDVGSITLNTLNNYNQKELFDLIKKDRLTYIDEICRIRPKNLKFKKGWINRVNNLKFSE